MDAADERTLYRLMAAEEAFNKRLVQTQNAAQGILVRTRKRLGWTARRMAKELGVHHVWLSYLENGKQRPSFETLERVHEILVGGR